MFDSLKKFKLKIWQQRSYTRLIINSKKRLIIIIIIIRRKECILSRIFCSSLKTLNILNKYIKNYLALFD